MELFFLAAAVFLTTAGGVLGVDVLQGPRLVREPPRGRLDFSNSTGGVLECGAQGSPPPTVRWLTVGGAAAEDVPGLRHVRPADNALVFLPFRAEDYRPEVHDAPYRCAATNDAGTVLSREVRVRGVVHQPYVVDVYDEFVVRGNTAVLRCRVPPNVQDYVSVTAWIRDGTLVIRPTALAGDRFSIFESGELHVRRVDRSDEMQQYRCETRHRLTGENVLSATAGRLLVTEAFREAAPRMTSSQRLLRAPLGSSLEAPCAAQGHPPPTYEWFRVSSPGAAPSPLPQPFGSRLLQLEGALLIRDLRPEDEGHYLCRATNAKGLAEAHTHIILTAPLSAQVLPPSAVVDVGRPASFNCSVSGRPVSGLVVEWRKDGRPLRPGQGVSVRQEEGVSLLHLSSVLQRDAGMYQCFVRNEMDDAAQGTAQLALGDYPPTLLETFPEQQTLSPGGALSLRCVAQARPLPQVTWTLDGAQLPDSGAARLRMGDYVRPGGQVISYVNVSGVRPEDGGLYACAAENAAGRAEHRGRVNVVGPPVVRPMPNVTAVAGDALWVTCPVGGHPVESVRWEKDGVRLPLNHRQKAWPNGTLFIRDVDKSSDAGRYACVAANSEGVTARGSMHVAVAVRPVIDPFSFPKSLSEGQRYSVLCTVTQGDPPIRISWTRPPSDGHASVRSVAVTPFSSSLVFDAVSPEQRGDYTCLAENRAGRTTHTATMVIHVPPKWRIEPSDSSATRGRPAVVDCQADGFPAPRIRWTKADAVPGEFRAISSSSRLQVQENGSLVVHSVQPQDAGPYLCQASNGVGQGLSKLVHLSVHVAAHFESKFRTESVRRGEEARLVCEALGDRPLHLTWLKDKETFKPNADLRYDVTETVSASSSSSTLIIRRADRRDSALYTCVAANAFGRDDTNIQLVVQEPPDPPQDAKLLEVDSRTAKIGWTPPYTGNSPILQYVLHYKEEKDRWQQHRSLNVTSSDWSAVVRGLTPTTHYHFRVVAENALGTGEPSNVVALATQQEAPGGPPLKVKAKGTGARTIKVSWKPPRSELQYGAIEGYYVGYRSAGSESPFVYKTLGPKEETQLTGLKRLTEYQVMVQAFNAKGASPPSDPVTAKTLENDPPGSPSVKVTFSNATSIGLAWEQTDTENMVQGYVVHHRWDLGEWQETEVVSGTTHAFHDLRCGSRYQFYVTAYNAVGRGVPSDTLRTKTQGTAPVAPDRQSLVTSNQTSAWVHLGTWSDGGCPISSFSVRYRQQRHQQWSTVGVTGPDVAIEDLSPGTWYRLQVTARNEAGSTDAEYTFVTSPAHFLTGGSAATDDGDEVPGGLLPLYLDVNILVPAAVSLAVVVALVALVCLIAHKKPRVRTDTAHTGCEGSIRSVKCESLPMSEKSSLKKALSDPRPATGYYPTPYATTRISAAEQQAEEPLYATVKRTPRPPRSDFHVYHYPGEMPEFFLQCKEVDELGAASSSSVYWKEAPETKLNQASEHAPNCSHSGGQRKSQRYSER